MSTEDAVKQVESAQQESEVHVLEDDAEERERKELLERRLEEVGDRPGDAEPGEDEVTRAAGSPATAIAEAKSHVGYRERGTNDTRFNRWLGRIPGYPHEGFGYPWCHSFVSYALWHSGNAKAGPRTAGCAVGVAWFKQRGRWHSTPKAGDLVYYGAGGGTHVELVSRVGQTTIETVGGNTSGSLGGNYFNGDGVYVKTVDRRSSRIHGYGRPAYRSSDGGGDVLVEPITSIRSVRGQQQAVNGLAYRPALDVDGEWGPKTQAGVKWLQKTVGTEPDGQWGPNTERKYKAHTT